MAVPVETKVKASTVAAAVSGITLWALGRYVFRGDVPDVVTSWTYAAVPAIITFAAGYLAKHTDRLVATATVTVAAARPEKTLLPPGSPPGPIPGP